MAAEFKLGGPLLGLDDAPSLPDPWRIALLRKHLGSQGHTLLCQVSKTSLHWLLTDWPTVATLTVPVLSPESAEQPGMLARRLEWAGRQLAVRGSRPATLILQQRGDLPREYSWWDVYLPPLAHSSDQLSVHILAQDIPAELLAAAGQAFPATTSITLNPLRQANSSLRFPSPDALPALRHLSIGEVLQFEERDVAWGSVAPHLAKVTSVTVGQLGGHIFEGDDSDDDWENQINYGTGLPYWAEMFTETSFLTSLSVITVLKPWLVRLLQEHAPSLQELACKSLWVPEEGTGLRRASVCSWRTLRVRAGRFHVPALAWLPLPAAGRLRVEAGTRAAPCAPVLSARWVPPTAADKLANRIDIEHVSTIQLAATQPAALTEALPAFTPFKTPDTELAVTGVVATAGWAAALRAAHQAGWCKLTLMYPRMNPDSHRYHSEDQMPDPIPPRFPPLHKIDLYEYFNSNYQLRHGVLAYMAQCLTSLDVLCCGPVRLEAPVVGPVPIGTVRSTGTMTLRQWLRQVEMVGEGVGWELKSLHVHLTENEADSGAAARIVERLRRVRLSGLQSITVHSSGFFAPAVQPRILRACLTVVNALPPCKLILSNWASTPPVIAELANLPPWSHITTFFKSPLPDTDYPVNTSADATSTDCPWALAKAPMLVPRSYTTWQVGATESDDIKALLYNLPRNRIVTRQLSVTVSYVGTTQPEWLGPISEELRVSKEHPYVSVSPWAVLVDRPSSPEDFLAVEGYHL